MIVFASVRLTPIFSASPNADCPYMIPKFTAFAALRIAPVTSLSATPYTFAAVAVCMSLFSLNAAIIFSSPLIAATMRNSICE